MSLSQIAKKSCSNHNNGDCCVSDLPCRICNGLPCDTFRTAVWKEIDPAYRYSRDHHVYKRNIAECSTGCLVSPKQRRCASVVAGPYWPNDAESVIYVP